MTAVNDGFLLNRRTFLKGTGLSLALPFMDSLAPAAAPAKPPVRLGFMYMPHGVYMDKFWPKDQEAFLTSPPPIIKSLQPIMDQCLMMKGISGVPTAPFNGAPHALELSTWLTARLPDASSRGRINIAISADQIMANYVGTQTSLPSLELATMPQTWKENQEGLHEGYYSYCSYRSPTQPVPAEIDPRNVLNRLFGKKGRRPVEGYEGPTLSTGRCSTVCSAARRDLRRTLGRDRSAEARRVPRQRANSRAANRGDRVTASRRAPWRRRASVRPGDDANDSPPIEVKIPEGDKRSEYMQVMCDLTVLAFQTDTTRVSTYIGSTPKRSCLTPNWASRTSTTRRRTTARTRKEMVQKVAAITKFNIDQFAYMVKKMAQHCKRGQRHAARQLHHDVGLRPGGR